MIRCDPSLSAKTLFLSLSPPLSLSLGFSSPLFLPCLAKIHCLSLKVTRRNRQRATRACKRVEERERAVEGKEERDRRSSPAGDRPRIPRGRQCTHSSRYVMDTAENPLKGSTRNKGQSPSTLVLLAIRRTSSVLLFLLACTNARMFNASLSILPLPLLIPQFYEYVLNLLLIFIYTFLS